MNTIAILQLVTALILLGEVQARLFSANKPRELYYNLTHPFIFLELPMNFATFFTFMETVIGMILAYNGFLTARGIV
jgi:hypothetical protein